MSLRFFISPGMNRGFISTPKGTNNKTDTSNWMCPFCFAYKQFSYSSAAHLNDT